MINFKVDEFSDTKGGLWRTSDCSYRAEFVEFTHKLGDWSYFVYRRSDVVVYLRRRLSFKLGRG